MGGRALLATLCVLVALSVVTVAEDAESYRAAVVEHAPISVPGQVSREEAVSVMFENLDVYEGHVEAAKADGAQIIVFNEDGLYGDDKCTRQEILPYLEYIPDPTKASQPIVLCDAPMGEGEWWTSEEERSGGGDTSPTDTFAFSDLLELEAQWLGRVGGNSSFVRQPVLRRVSCMAREHSIVIVLDMGDLQPCSSAVDSDCPSDGRYQYNTQVAFDESGALLAKYHKTHLYYEPQFNSGMPSVPVTFTTSFDVTFAMMICFDMMFAHPTLDYITQHDPPITDMVYSTWWVNTPPDFSATQIQQAYSRAMGLNVLASGNGISWVYSGSGIYSEGRVLLQHYNPTYTPMDKLLVTTVPRITRSNFTPMPMTASPLTSSVAGSPPPLQPMGRFGRSFERASDWRDAPSDRTPFESVSFAQLRCPLNSTYYIGEKAEPEEGSPLPMSHAHHTGREQHYQYSYGNLTLSTPFEATWGAENLTSTAVAGNLTCTATMSVSALQPFLNGKDAEIFTVLAWEGWYDGTVDYYQERFCAVFRCYTAETCLSALIYSHTFVDSFRLEGNFAYGTTLYGLVASDILLLVEDAEKITVGFEGGSTVNAGPTTATAAAAARTVAEENVGYVEAGAEFDTVLLNASLLGRLLYEDDSDNGV